MKFLQRIEQIKGLFNPLLEETENPLIRKIIIDIDEYATTGTEERVADINLCYFRKDTGTYITVGTIECTQTPPSQN